MRVDLRQDRHRPDGDAPGLPALETVARRAPDPCIAIRAEIEAAIAEVEALEYRLGSAIAAHEHDLGRLVALVLRYEAARLAENRSAGACLPPPANLVALAQRLGVSLPSIGSLLPALAGLPSESRDAGALSALLAQLEAKLASLRARRYGPRG